MPTAYLLGAAVVIAAAACSGGKATEPADPGRKLEIRTVSLGQGRIHRAYSHTLSAANGGSPYVWSVAGGSLPAGVALSEAGVLSGTPSVIGTFEPVVRVTSDDVTAEKRFTLRICGDTVDPAVGQSIAVAFPESCGVLLPSGNDRLYRIAAMPRRYEIASNQLVWPTPGSLLLRARTELSAPSSSSEGPRATLATMANAEVRSASGRWPSHMSPTTYSPGTPRPEFSRSDSPIPPSVAFGADPPASRTFDLTPAYGLTVNTTLRAVGTNLIFYQADAGIASPLTDTQLQELMAEYDGSTLPVVEEYFGGLGPSGSTTWWKDGPRPARDIDGNGRVILVQMPDIFALKLPDGYGRAVATLATDRYPRPANAAPNAPSPFAAGVQETSNEGEIIYASAPMNLASITRGARQLSGHGYASFGGKGGVDDLWLEEGSTIFAIERAFRRRNGFADGAALTRADMPEVAGMVAPNLRAFMIGSPGNSLYGTPLPPFSPGPDAAAWLFHTFLTDNYGAALGGGATLIRRLNTEGRSIANLAAVVGKPHAELVAEFLAALSVEGQPAARAAAPLRLSSYDLADVAQFTGDAWPHKLLDSFAYQDRDRSWITTYYGSIAFVDVTSTPTTTLRLDLLQTNGAALDPAVNGVLVVTRLR